MASIREIRQRREGIRSAQQITKAMKLASTAKLQKARRNLEEARPYHNQLRKIMAAVAADAQDPEIQLRKHVAAADVPDPDIYGERRGSSRKAVVVVSSNRGLAGGYNHQIVRMVTEAGELPVELTDICALGRKGRDGLARLGYEIRWDDSETMETITYSDARRIMSKLLEACRDGGIGEIYLAYTSFQNTITHTPVLLKLLPLGTDAEEEDQPLSGFRNLPMNYEYTPGGDQDEAAKAASVLDALIPQYLTGMLYGACLEAAASEHGARMAAMDHASENARELIEELTADYNQARQSLITRELTEIIAGASAIT